MYMFVLIGFGNIVFNAVMSLAITRLARAIVSSPDHLLNQHFTLLPSGGRYRVLDWKKAHFKISFVPSAIAALNKNM